MCSRGVETRFSFPKVLKKWIKARTSVYLDTVVGRWQPTLSEKAPHGTHGIHESLWWSLLLPPRRKEIKTAFIYLGGIPNLDEK